MVVKSSLTLASASVKNGITFCSFLGIWRSNRPLMDPPLRARCARGREVRDYLYCTCNQSSIDYVHLVHAPVDVVVVVVVVV